MDTSEVFSGIYSRKTLSEVQDDTYILLYHMSNASSSSSSPVLPCSEGSNSMTELSQDERYGEEVVQVERFDGLNPPPVDLLTRDAFAERIEREQITDGINTPPLYLLHNCLYRMLPCCRFFNFNRNFNFADTDTNSTALRTCTAAVHSHSCSNRTQPIHHPINRLLNNQMDSGTGTRDPFKVAEPSVPSRYLVLHLKGSECVVARQSAETPTMGRFFENIIDMSKKSFRKIPKCKDDDRSTSKGGSQGTTEKNEGRHKEEAIASVSSEEKRDEILCRSSARKCKDTMERASSIAGIYNPSRTRTTGSSVDSRKPVKSVPEIIEDVSKLPNQIVDTNNDGAIRQPQLSTQLMTGPQAPSDAQPTSTLKGKIIHADTSPSITSASQQISQSSSPFTSPSISDPPSRGGSRVEGSVVTYQLESMAFLGYVLTVCTPCKTALPPHPLVSTYSPPLEEKINADNSMNLIMTASNRRHSYNSFQNRNRRSESRNHHVIPEKESDTIVGLMSGTNSSAGDEVRDFAEVELPQFFPPSQPPSQLPSQPPSQLSSQLSSQPPSQLPSQPSSQPPSQLPSQPSSQPHSQPPSQLPSQPTSQPHSRSHSRPQSLPHSQPHSQPHSPSTSDDAWKYFFLHGSACL